jgi:DNA polymerase I-like protein with 3'-5' exonuclease and polymerase domains
MSIDPSAVPAEIRAAAAFYLAQGRLPVPIPRVGNCKAPFLDDWQNLRPTPADLDRLFPAGQDLNVGLLLGAPSGGLIDVDLDTAEAVTAGALLLPATGWISGRQGKQRSHWWYLMDDPPDKASQQFRDVDQSMLAELRSTGGQTMAPPSIHPSGERVEWHELTEPARVAAPDLRRVVARTAAAALLARHWPAEGSRQDTALALAGGLTRAGWSADDVEYFLRVVTTTARDDEVDMRVNTAARTAEKIAAGEKATGWPKLAELLGENGKAVVGRLREWLVLSGVKGAGDPKKKASIRPPAPYRSFPVEALPEPIRSFVIQAAASIGCDPVYVALPALSVAASQIGNSRAIRVKRDWYEPSVVWSGIVGYSGTLKSPAFRAAVGPLYRLQRTLIRKFKSDFQEYQKEKDAYDARKAQAKKDKKPFDEEEPEKATIARVVTGDVTIEKLAQLLEDNPKGLLVARDELGGWLTSFQRYKGKSGGSDLQNWLELYQAGTIQYDRKTGDRPVVFVQHAAVSVAGGIQPGVLARVLTPEYMDAGLGARILMAMPPRRRKDWTEAEIDPLVKDAYEAMLAQLRELQLDKGEDGEKEPFAVKMTPEAKAVWVDFYRDWARVQESVEGELAAAYSKLEGAAARLALLYHVVSRVGELEDCQPIDPVSIHAGVTLARWFAYEARRIYTALAETEDQKQTRNLVDLLRSWGGSSTVRRLQHASARYKTAEAAEAALNGLVGDGLADWSERPAGPRGGRPTRVCVLRPETDTTKTDTTPDEEDPEDDGFGDGVPTQPPDTTPLAGGISPVSGGCVGFVVVSKNYQAHGGDPLEGSGAGEVVSEPSGEVVSEPPTPREDENCGSPEPAHAGRGGPRTADETDTTSPWMGSGRSVRQVGEGVFLVSGPDGLELALRAVEESAVLGLDVETTGLNPRTDRVRLLQLATDRGVYLTDCFRVDPRPLWEALLDKPIVFHNAAFDLGFLGALGYHPAGPVHDTMLLSQLLHGTRKPKGFHGLAQTTGRELGRTLNKAEQRSDWSGELTAQQLAYAAADAAILPPLYASLVDKIKAAGLSRAAEIEGRALLAVTWMGRQGVAFDRAAWDDLAGDAAAEAEVLARNLDDAAPDRPGRLIREGAWNWSSVEQVKEAFAALGLALESTDDDALAAIPHPLAQLLRNHRSATKLASTYGPRWYADTLHDGRVYAGWKQIGADSGRMACASPNLQNLPRDPRYRRGFIAPPGRVLVKADYSQIELRIAAKIAGDKAMLDAYGRGDDLHKQTAQRVLGVETPTKDQRQIAKSLNFGLLYGMGARGLRTYAKSQYGVEFTEAQAREYRAAFFRAYPGLARWHEQVRRRRDRESRTVADRRRLFDAKTPDTHRLNTPVQGTGADGLKLALALLWERRAEAPGAFPVLAVHDEIVVECDTEQAGAVEAWLKQAMLDGMAPLVDPVPVEVETRIARTWGGE